jgi:hypothetical protein
VGGPGPPAHRRINRVDGVDESAEQPAESDGIACVLAVAAALDQNDGCVVADRLGQCEAVMLRSYLIFGAVYDEYGAADSGTHVSEGVGVDLVAEPGVGDGRQRGFVSPADTVLDGLGGMGLGEGGRHEKFEVAVIVTGGECLVPFGGWVRDQRGEGADEHDSFEPIWVFGGESHGAVRAPR